MIWDSHVFWDDLLRIGAAALLGGLLGLEREWKGHWAGLRTHMMVSIGCAIFVIGGLGIAKGDPQAVTRVIQGVASGIGFLGAGTILKLDDKQEIKGLTTASSIWLAAALGTAAGLAEFALATASAVMLHRIWHSTRCDCNSIESSTAMPRGAWCPTITFA
jgi:putative Mg2+ transporter-C (MgtC) family protein